MIGDIKGSSVIFCAPDNCGKTTQVELLKNYLIDNFIYTHMLHYSSIKVKDVKYCSEHLYYDAFHMILENQTKDRVLLFDRLHGGEWVYGKIYRKYDANFIFDIEHQYLNDFFGSSPIKKLSLIVFIDTPQRLLDREDGKSFSENVDDKLSVKQFEIDRFIDFFNKSMIKNKILIDISSKNIQEVHNIIKNFLGVS